MRITVAVESAKMEVKICTERIFETYGIPSCVAEGILYEVIAELKCKTKEQIIKDKNEVIREKNEELEKAKKEAKKVIRTEPEEIPEKEEQPEE